MPYKKYDKPYLLPPQLISALEAKGLSFHDKGKAERFLETINYYRFKIYLHPYLQSCGKKFKPDTYFEHGVQLYRFDEELRIYLLKLICRIEVKLRTRLDQVVTSTQNEPYWYLVDSNFQQSKLYGKVSGFRQSIASAFVTCREDYATHFKDNYYNATNAAYKFLPPFWVAGELTTFGNIMNIYDSLDKTPFQVTSRQNSLDDLAREFGANNLKTLNQWLKSIRDIRNRCAHHNRVWSCNYRAPNRIVPQLSISPSNDNRLYTTLAMFHVISKTLQLDESIRYDIYQIIHKYPAVKKHLWIAGFPERWFFDQFWR
ncbi:Abi family protein [Vibrio cholerae]|uniref:Abi family protein n=1 Tax=Vibrio cholerae TaxID=666 RepID=UPI00158142EE|nr:Abi family protein [Vibrio cholerae]EJL6311404.1 Abi family protein [Vibrio cholerae]EJL6608173.1 Abi family protein [Vibrio cholerae]EJL6662197.1 Abi family protein [Vibrio cholerae]EKF9843203.1 Abi family protein [Vibrio cholerae]EKZ8587503.1 Abi family protein [Vibrio cholerae]